MEPTEKRKTKRNKYEKEGIKENWNGKRILAFVTGGWNMLGRKTVMCRGCGFFFAQCRIFMAGIKSCSFSISSLLLICVLFFRLRKYVVVLLAEALCDLRCGCLLFSARVCC
jgi:hypothetical protein